MKETVLTLNIMTLSYRQYHNNILVKQLNKFQISRAFK